MAAYLIVYMTVSNPEQLKKYQAVTPAALAKYDGRFLVRGGPKVTVEGPGAGPFGLALRGIKGSESRMRTLGFAMHRECGEGTDIEQLAQGLTWLGFAAIADPVRPEVPDAIKACKQAGIEVKIITGDNSETAKEIGRQIGLIEGEAKEGEHMTGPQFGEIADEPAHGAIEGIHLLSRARPLVTEMHELVTEARRGRHQQLPVDDLVAIAVVG